MTLSVVMIVKNEEELLGRCLDSVKDADEIIICDTGSEDKTIEIAKQYTRYVFTDYKWNDNFAEARNHAASKATGDWILVIDADEYLLPPGIPGIRDVISRADSEGKTTMRVVMEGKSTHFTFPRLYKNDAGIKFEGAIHNHLNKDEGNTSDIVIHYDYSPAHQKDPGRALRILERVFKDNPTPRDTYYLAREYWYAKRYDEALAMFKGFLQVSDNTNDSVLSYMYMARIYFIQGKLREAQDSCLGAIRINADNHEALMLMAGLSGPNNRRKWIEYAQYAENNFVTMKDSPPERGPYYYDWLFSQSSDMSRYAELHKLAASWCEGKVLDVGCGTGEMRNYIEDWHGFDFAPQTIARIGDHRAWVASAYNLADYYMYDTYLFMEVLEHLDDFRVLRAVPTSKRIVFSVPSFPDPSHLRVYSSEILQLRYKHMMKIDKIVRFNWKSKWVVGGPDTSDYILLVKATRG